MRVRLTVSNIPTQRTPEEYLAIAGIPEALEADTVRMGELVTLAATMIFFQGHGSSADDARFGPPQVVAFLEQEEIPESWSETARTCAVYGQAISTGVMR